VRLDGVVFKSLRSEVRITQELIWRTANHNPCLAHFLDLAAAAD